MKTKYVPRVNQLDSLQLDTEIQVILKDILTKALHTFSPTFWIKFQPELNALLKSILWKLSVFDNCSTFGQQLLSITYDHDQLNKQKLLMHFILNITFGYLKDNGTLRLTKYTSIQKVLYIIENLLSILHVVNFFRFLKTGRWCSTNDFILGLDYITLLGNKRRNIGYTYMTRELIWGGFMELLGFTVPLINYRALSRKVQNFWKSKPQVTNDDSNKYLTVTTLCAYCNERPVLPYCMECEHIFCYYCLQGNILIESKYTCPECSFVGKTLRAY